MDTKPPIIDLEPLPAQTVRRGDGGTYLVIADDSDEFRGALRYACRLVREHRARLGILRIIEDQDFQQWGIIEDKMKREMREAGEKYLWSVAKVANDAGGIIPSLYFAEGEPGEALARIVEEDDHIVKIILGGGEAATPGPLVGFCVGKGLARLRVPVLVVPGNLKEIS
ncbi:MAG: universal stress protein [Micavibrio sp.]